MAYVKLRAKRPTITVAIGDEREVEVPLTFTRSEFEAIGESEDSNSAVFEFFRTYLGDVVDDIGDDDFAALLNAWGEARAEIGEPPMGES